MIKNPACNPRGLVDVFNIPYTTLNTVIPVGTVGIGDLPVKLPLPTTRLMLCSIGPVQADEAFGLGIHFTKLSKDYSASAVTLGSENWIQLHTGDLSTTVFLEGTIIEFPTPIQNFLVDVMGTPSSAVRITFGCVDGVRIYWKPQASTSA